MKRLENYGKQFVAKFNPCNVCLIFEIVVLFKEYIAFNSIVNKFLVQFNLFIIFMIHSNTWNIDSIQYFEY